MSEIKCVYCGEEVGEVREKAKYEGIEYLDCFYKCSKCGEEFETYKQLGENMTRIREAIKNVQKEKR